MLAVLAGWRRCYSSLCLHENPRYRSHRANRLTSASVGFPSVYIRAQRISNKINNPIGNLIDALIRAAELKTVRPEESSSERTSSVSCIYCSYSSADQFLVSIIACVSIKCDFSGDGKVNRTGVCEVT